MEISKVSMNFPFSRNQTWSPLDRKCGFLPPVFPTAVPWGCWRFDHPCAVSKDLLGIPKEASGATQVNLEISGDREFPPGPPQENNKKNHAKLRQDPMKWTKTVGHTRIIAIKLEGNHPFCGTHVATWWNIYIFAPSKQTARSFDSLLLLLPGWNSNPKKASVSQGLLSLLWPLC